MSKNRVRNFFEKNNIVYFYFDGIKLRGFHGESLASALLANGIKLVGRSFKYHRPRGIMALGAEEPNALVSIINGNEIEPNIQATQLEIFDALNVVSQNRWPNLRFDFGSILSLFSNLLPAGFYYKTFMWPNSMWKTYEHFIRKMSGLGKASNKEQDSNKYEHINFHVDILIVGGGPTGLLAASILAESGIKVLIADENPVLGGSMLYENDIKINSLPCKIWADQLAKTLKNKKNVTILNRSTVFGYHDHNYITITEKCSINTSYNSKRSPKQRLWMVRAKKVVLAQGMIERPLTIPGNDIPGVMLSASIRGYINKFGVLPGNEVVLFTNNDDAYRTAIELNKVRANLKYIVDIRKKSSGKIIEQVKKLGVKVLFNHCITSISGNKEVQKVQIYELSEDGKELINTPINVKVDLVGLSGGWSPSVNLFSQSGGKLKWDNNLNCFKPNKHVQEEITIGGCDGNFNFENSLTETLKKTNKIIKEFGKKINKNFKLEIFSPTVSNEIKPFWQIPSSQLLKSQDKAFVDFQNDVIARDISLAADEGYQSIEHLKRYTTLGMGTDQGKTSNISGLGILSEKISKDIPSIGTTTFRMPHTPITFGAIGGKDIKNLFDPIRLTKIDPWQRKNNAKFEHVGQWMRAWYYPRHTETMQTTINREVLNTRNNAGILDASTLGKIDIKGKDSRKFLNMIYTNDWSKIQKGHCKYGIMLKEDGMVMDDGVTSCINDNHFHMTTTTGGASNVMSWMEEWLQTEWPNMEVFLTSVTEQWSVMSISGPKSREILKQVECDINLSNETFPFMTFKTGTMEGVPVKIFRISFTGELSYEINVPSRYGLFLWEKILKAGNKYGLMPYGTETMHVLRAEKGFIIAGQETDGSVNPYDLGMSWIVSKKKKDFIGKKSLSITSLSKNRKQLVGLLTENPNKVLPEGAHAVKNIKQGPPFEMLGHVTSSYFSPNCKRSIALALIKNGHSMYGKNLYFPLLNKEIISAKIVKPVFFDPEGERQNGI